MSNSEPGDQGEPLDPQAAIIREELDRRLQLFDDLDDLTFGAFTTLDWTLCTVLFFFLPLFIAWWLF